MIENKQELLEEMTKRYIEKEESIAKILKDFPTISRYIFSKYLKSKNIEIKNSTVGTGRKRQCKMNDNFFKEINTEEKAYWLGFIYADGYVMEYEQRVGIAIHIKDVDHLYKFRKHIESDVNINEYIGVQTAYGETSYCRIILNSKEMYRDLVFHGVLPHKSNILKPPTTVPQNLINHFIRGYFDGDGSYIQGQDKRLSFVGTKEVLDFIIQNIPIENKNPRLEKRNVDDIVYDLKFGGKDRVEEVLKYIYKNSSIFLDRKYKLFVENHPMINLQRLHGRNLKKSQL